MRNTGLEEAEDGIKITGININMQYQYAPQICRWCHPYGRKRRKKSLLMKMNQESETVGLKLKIQKSKIMASGPITSWQIDGETVEIVADFIFWCSKNTADFDCSLEIKRCLLLEWKVMTSLDSILKDREITLPGKVCLVKTMFLFLFLFFFW